MPGINTLYLFPVYQTREAFGSGAPAYDPSKPIKSWMDPAPPPADEDGNVQYLCLALASDKKTPAVKDGKPYLRMMRISRADAMAVNIPPKDFARDTRLVDPGSIYPMASIEVPVPCKELNLDEELAFGWGGLVEVRKKASGGGAPVVVTGDNSAILAAIKSQLDTVAAQQEIILAVLRTPVPPGS